MNTIYETPKICVICGKSFDRGNPRAITCSPECSEERRRQRQKQIAETYDYSKYYEKKQEVQRRENRFGSFESFAKWAQRMLEGVDLSKYK